MFFPWDEFRGLANKVIEIVEDSETPEESKVKGRALLQGVMHRIIESDDTDLKAKVTSILKHEELVYEKKTKTNLRELIAWISRETDAGSVYVLKRTDRLGDRSLQEEAIREYFTSLGHDDISLWFAPERSGQKKPAMVFIGFKAYPPSDLADAIPVRGKSIACTRFNYDAT
jgi:hypothetical protein